MISGLLTRPIPKPARQVKADPQRSRLYKMEREFVGSAVYHKVSKADLETVSRHACRYYRVKPPKLVVYNNPDEHVFGRSYEGGEIHLNRGYHGANLATLLHELAHYIIDETYEDERYHDPRFCGVYMHLLDKYRVLPAVAFRALAKKWRIKIAGCFKPDAIRP